MKIIFEIEHKNENKLEMRDYFNKQVEVIIKITVLDQYITIH